jgi:thiopeptide-type bacteriocin biosynthesis protein
MEQRCLYTLLHAEKSNHEPILLEWAAPLTRTLRDDARLDSLFFARYNKPDWQIRYRVLGDPAWVDGPVRAAVGKTLEPLRDRGAFSSLEFATYEREYERYGGPEGMRLSEKIFYHDTVACLELIEAEARGRLSKSRREYSLVLTECVLDLFGFDRAQRIAFYEFGYRWTREVGGWEPDEFQLLEQRYQGLRGGLVELVDGRHDGEAEASWGGEQPAAIAHRCLDATRPVVEELLAAHAAGRVHQDPLHLAWSYCHMHCNRLGVATPAEAILRFFMHRLHEERRVGIA